MPKDEVRELQLFIENDGALYRQQYQPILKNLALKKARGVYDSAKAAKLFGYLVDAGAKKYAREFASPGEWNRMFTVADRKEVARNLTRDFETEHDLGNYKHLLPAKYQRVANPVVRDKWVAAQIKITKAGKILAKIAPAALGKKRAVKRAATKKRAVPKKKTATKKRARR